MAKQNKANKKLNKRGKITLGVFAALFLSVLIVAGIGIVNAEIVHIRRAEVVIADLPPAFDGVTLLYASDIDLCGLNTASKSGTLFNRLQSLRPDILLLGGDYSSVSLLDQLNRPSDHAVDDSTIPDSRTGFFHFIASFDAPLGKYAIAAPEDPDWEDLKALMAQCDVQPLFNARVEVRKDGASLWLAGVSEEDANLNAAGRGFSRDDCVLVVCYSPAVLPVLLTSEASDGGRWSDLALCGHTHGGQVRLFGHTVLSLSESEKRFLSGWNTDSGLPILTTEGIGCEGLNLRLGTAPEVWLITLKGI